VGQAALGELLDEVVADLSDDFFDDELSEVDLSDDFSEEEEESEDDVSLPFVPEDSEVAGDFGAEPLPADLPSVRLSLR
jgi:hypothetical protein